MLISSLESEIKNYAVMSQYGNGGDNKTVTLIPISFEDIPRAAKSSQIDGIVRLNPDKTIYRIQIGKTIYSDAKEILEMAKILGLHKENRGRWSFSDKKFLNSREIRQHV